MLRPKILVLTWFSNVASETYFELRMLILFSFFKVYDQVVNPSGEVATEEGEYEGIHETDQASHERHSIPDEELTEKTKMWPYY